MNDTKPWYLSRGVLASIVTVIAGALAVATHNKVQILPSDQDQLISLILTGVTVIGGAVSWWGRVAATKIIASKGP